MRVVRGSFESLLYSAPEKDVVDSISRDIDNLSSLSGLSESSRRFTSSMRDRFDKSFGFLGTLSRKIDIELSQSSIETELNIFSDPRSLLSINHKTMKFAMANMRLKSSHLRGELSSWDGDYIEETSDVGEDDDYYRRVVDGLVVDDEEGNSSCVNYMEAAPEEDVLDLFDQSRIKELWEVLEDGLDDNMDLTDPFSISEYFDGK